MYHSLVPIVVVLVKISSERYPRLLTGTLITAAVVYTRLRNFSASP